MPLFFRVIEATGRATCKICKQKIKKGEKAMMVTGWMTCGQAHMKCGDEK